MRFQDTLRFSLKLVLPEKVVRTLQKVKKIGVRGVLSPARRQTNAYPNLRLLIEEIDHDRGGLSFGTDTISLMTVALDQAIASYPQPVETEQVHKIINCIMAV